MQICRCSLRDLAAQWRNAPRLLRPTRAVLAARHRYSPRLEAGFLDQARSVGSLLLQVAGKVLRRVENRLNTDVDQPRLTERWLVADATDVLVQLLDNGLGRAGRGNEPEVNRREIGKAELGERRHVGKERRAGVGIHGQRLDRAAADVRDEVGQADD